MVNMVVEVVMMHILDGVQRERWRARRRRHWMRCHNACQRGIRTIRVNTIRNLVDVGIFKRLDNERPVLRHKYLELCSIGDIQPIMQAA